MVSFKQLMMDCYHILGMMKRLLSFPKDLHRLSFFGKTIHFLIVIKYLNNVNLRGFCVFLQFYRSLSPRNLSPSAICEIAFTQNHFQSLYLLWIQLQRRFSNIIFSTRKNKSMRNYYHHL